MARKIGFIGYGSMGSMLMEGFIREGAVREEDVWVSTRTKAKLETIKAHYPGVHTVYDNSDAVRFADLLFVCVKPLDFPDVLEEIRPVIDEHKHLVSIAGPVKVKQIESLLPCRVTKLIPTATSLVSGGISLVCHGERVSDENKSDLEAMLSAISTVKCVPEAQIPLATELTSCGPGLYSAILKELASAALRHGTAITREEAEEMILRTMLGTCRLALERGLSLDGIIGRVATKGGITEEGVKVFYEDLPNIFDRMFDVTLEKRRLVDAKVRQGFETKEAN